MAKRFLLVSVLAAFVVGGIFAQMPQMSIGAGYIHSAGSIGGTFTDKAAYNGIEGLTDNSIGRANQNGGFVFFDATYAELAIGLMGTSFGEKSVNTVIVANSEKTDKTRTDTLYEKTGLAMDISLLGRYPIPVGKMTISPLLGVGYNLVLGMKDANGEKEEFKDSMTGQKAKWGIDGDEKKAGDWSTFRIQLGAGADFDVTDRIYLRTQGLAHYRFASKAFGKNGAGKELSEAIKNDTTFKGGFGGSFTVAVGYKF